MATMVVAVAIGLTLAIQELVNVFMAY